MVRQDGDAQPIERRGRHGVRLHGEDRLDERSGGARARRGERLHELLERHALPGHGFQQVVPDLDDQSAKARRRANVHGNGDGVGQIADHGFLGGAFPGGNRGADQQTRHAGHAGQQQRPGGERRHVRGGALATPGGGGRRRNVGSDAHRERVAAPVGDSGARPVGRQVESRGITLQRV